MQSGVKPEPGADPRKYEIGRLLTFRAYSPDEVKVVPCSTFKRGDVLRVLPRNGCGMGIDVVRVQERTERVRVPQLT